MTQSVAFKFYFITFAVQRLVYVYWIKNDKREFDKDVSNYVISLMGKLQALNN